MHAPKGFRLLREVGGRAIVRADLLSLPLDRWWAQGEPLAAAAGRAGVQVLEVAPGVWAAMRDYRRGGALRMLLHDRFLSTGRAAREVAVLLELRGRGVPVVEPLAALARRRGWAWRLRLATRLVEGGLPLPAYLTAHPEQRRAVLHAAGAVVGLAFAAGLRHPDLHPDNLIVSQGDGGPHVQLVDLDRAEVGPRLSERARDAMLLRMARYLERHAARLPAARRSDQLRFLQGMGLSSKQRRVEIRRLEPEYQRAVARHRMSWKATARGS